MLFFIARRKSHECVVLFVIARRAMPDVAISYKQE